MKFLCLICARGGSKGIKNKNLLKIGKKLCYNIQLILQRKLIYSLKLLYPQTVKK